MALASLLVRPCPAFPDPISIKQTSLTHENYGSVKRVYIISGQDKGFTVDLQKWMIEKNPPDEVKEIPDADHMVMLSKPKELFSYLLEIANKYCWLRHLFFLFNNWRATIFSLAITLRVILLPKLLEKWVNAIFKYFEGVILSGTSYSVVKVHYSFLFSNTLRLYICLFKMVIV